MQSAHCSFSPHTVPYILQETQDTVQFRGYSVQCSVSGVQYTVNSVQCTVYRVRKTKSVGSRKS